MIGVAFRVRRSAASPSRVRLPGCAGVGLVSPPLRSTIGRPAGSLQAAEVQLRPSAMFSDERRCTRKNNPDFRELTWLRIDLDRPRMLLDNDVVGDRQAKAGTFARGFCCEEGVEHLFPYFGRNAEAIVANDRSLITRTRRKELR